jgi:hypothetical protein
VPRVQGQSPDEPANTLGRYHIAAQEDRSAIRTKLAIPRNCAPPAPAPSRPSSTTCRCRASRHGDHPHASGFGLLADAAGLESLQAEVVWWENNMCGCAFNSLLSPIVHDNILARYRGDGTFRG